MTNQERNRDALIEHIAEQDRIIRRRNEQIANQAHNARESQRAIEELDARNNSLAADLAAAVARADKAEKERDHLATVLATTTRQRDEADKRNARPLTADDITDEMIQRAKRRFEELDGALVCTRSDWVFWQVLAAALTEPPRPEGAEKVEAVLHQYWSGDINGDDLADRIAEEMNR